MKNQNIYIILFLIKGSLSPCWPQNDHLGSKFAVSKSARSGVTFFPNVLPEDMSPIAI